MLHLCKQRAALLSLVLALFFAFCFGAPNVLADSITSTANPTSLPSGGTLKDTATLSGTSMATGTITFTLFFDGGATLVDTETVSVSGNGSYATPTGFTVPTSGGMDGVYQWDVVYSGDTFNLPVSDNNDPNEQVVVGPAVASPEPASLMLLGLGLLGAPFIRRKP